MKNIIEVAAWVVVVKNLLPIILGLGFVVVAVAAATMDKVTKTDTNYDGVKLRIRRKENQ